MKKKLQYCKKLQKLSQFDHPAPPLVKIHNYHHNFQKVTKSSGFYVCLVGNPIFQILKTQTNNNTIKNHSKFWLYFQNQLKF